MRCAKGIFASTGGGFWDVRSFAMGERGLRLPLAVGKKGLRLPRSLGRSMRNEGLSDPFLPSQEGVSDLFSQRKKENPVHPKIPLAKIPLAQLMRWDVFLCILFFLSSPCPPHPLPGISLPKTSSFGLLFLAEERQPPGAGCWGGVLGVVTA